MIERQVMPLGRLPRLVRAAEAWLGADGALPADPTEAAESLRLALLGLGVPAGRAYRAAAELADALADGAERRRLGGARE